MAASTEVSCVFSLILCLLLFSGCLTCRPWLAATPIRTIIGGYVTSLLFTVLLTMIGNLQTILLGKGTQVGLFPGVTMAFMGALGTAALIHRVCVTTCIIFSGISLYFMNKLSQKTYSIVAPPSGAVITHKKKRH